MKIGILTYQNAINYGAAYQCVALYEFLKKSFPKDSIEIINYNNKNIKDKSNFIVQMNKSTNCLKKIKLLISWPILLYRNSSFKKFFKNIAFSKFYDISTINEINGKYDYVIIGSDQLWNFSLNGNDSTYFLPFYKNKKNVITYSTSFGAKIIPECLTHDFCTSVREFKTVSVRENEGRDLFIKLGLNPPKVTIDPVLLIDNVFWYKKIKPNKNNSAIFYFFHAEYVNDAYAFLNNLPDKIDLIFKICGGISFSDYLSNFIKVKAHCGPAKVLNLIANSRIVFTDSFHCTVMSIVFHVPFVTFLTGDEGSDSRLLNILKLCGLENRIFKKNYDITSNIDWTDVEKKLDVLRNDSKEYLLNAIGV